MSWTWAAPRPRHGQSLASPRGNVHARLGKREEAQGLLSGAANHRMAEASSLKRSWWNSSCCCCCPASGKGSSAPQGGCCCATMPSVKRQGQPCLVLVAALVATAAGVAGGAVFMRADCVVRAMDVAAWTSDSGYTDLQFGVRERRGGFLRDYACLFIYSFVCRCIDWRGVARGENRLKPIACFG